MPLNCLSSLSSSLWPSCPSFQSGWDTTPMNQAFPALSHHCITSVSSLSKVLCLCSKRDIKSYKVSPLLCPASTWHGKANFLWLQLFICKRPGLHQEHLHFSPNSNSITQGTTGNWAKSPGPRLYCNSYILINPAINVFTCYVTRAH